MKNLLYLILPFTLIISCDPIELPPPDNIEPVFTTQMEIDGNLVQFESGKLNIVNDPSFNISKNNQLTYVSKFIEESCNRICPNSLIFSINSTTFFNKNKYDFNASFPKTKRDYNWQYVDNNVKLLVQTNRKDENKLFIEEQWVQGNAADLKSNQWKAVRNILTQKSDIKISTDKSTQLCRALRLKNNNNAIFISCKDLNTLESNDGKDSLQLEIKIEKTGNEIILTAITTGYPIRGSKLEYVWNNTSKSKSIRLKNLKGRNFVKVYDPILKNRASAEIIFTDNQLVRDHLKISSSFNILKSVRNTNPDKIQHGTISILYINSKNKVFNSNNFRNPVNSEFNITRIEDYEEVDSSVKYKKITAAFNCILFDAQGQRLVIKNGQATFAVRIPER